MNRSVVSMLFVVVMQLAISCSVCALPSYIWNTGGYDQNGANGVYTFYGQQASTSYSSMNVASTQAAVASLAFTGSVGDAMVKTALLQKNFWAAPAPTNYVLQAWAGLDFVGDTISVRVWATTAVTQVPANGWRLFKLFDPTTQLWGVTQLSPEPIMATSSGSYSKPWFEVSLPVFRTESPLDSGQGYILLMSMDENPQISCSMPIVTDDGVSTTNPTCLHATWSAPDGTDYSEYQYAVGTSPDNLIVEWKMVGSTTEATETGLSLQLGETYYWYVRGLKDQVWSNIGSSNGITLVRPASPVVADDGAGTTNATRLHFSWTADDPWGVDEYRYAIGTSPLDLVVDWKSVGMTTEITETGLSSDLGATYYAYVQARNGPGLWSEVGSSDGITVVRPSPPTVTDHGLYCPLTADPYSSWTASDPWGIEEYRYALGVSPDELVVDWRSAGLATEAIETGLSLVPGSTYYFYVKYLNGGSLWSEIGSSDGITIATPCSIGDAKTENAGKPVHLQNAVVTSTTSDHPGLWIESGDRAGGVRVGDSLSLARGQKLDVAGVVSWTDGVPTLGATEIKNAYSQEPIIPPFFTTRPLANDRTESLNYVGVNPVGLLAALAGRVTRIDTSSAVFYVDDGTRLADGMGPSYDPFIGLRISYPTSVIPPAPGKRVRVTGIRTVQKVTLQYGAFVNGEYRFPGETLYLPVVRVRDQADIRVY